MKHVLWSSFKPLPPALTETSHIFMARRLDDSTEALPFELQNILRWVLQLMRQQSVVLYYNGKYLPITNDRGDSPKTYLTACDRSTTRWNGHQSLSVRGENLHWALSGMSPNGQDKTRPTLTRTTSYIMQSIYLVNRGAKGRYIPKHRFRRSRCSRRPRGITNIT